MSDPTVSIVIPCFNAGQFLAETIRSALAQTLTPSEIIVVDDGSVDDSVAIAETFGSPVRVVKQANQGVSVARNRGAVEARGTHLLFLDADDLLDRESLTRLAAAIEGARDVPVMGYRVFRGVRENVVKESLPHSATFFPVALGNHISHVGCWLIPRGVMDETGGFMPGLRNGEDWLFAAQLGFTGANMKVVRHLGYLYRKHPASQMATATGRDRQRDRLTIMTNICEQVLKRPEFVRELSSHAFWLSWAAIIGARREHVEWREAEPLERALRKLLKADPGIRRSSWTALASSVMGVRWAMRLRLSVVAASNRTNTRCD